MRSKFTAVLAAGVVALPGLAARAQNVLPGDYSIIGHICAGTGCTASETFTTDLKVKSAAPSLLLNDSSAAGPTTRDWKITVDGDFTLEDAFGNGTVLTFTADAPQNAMVIDGSGNLGLGTLLPQNKLHVVSDYRPGAIFEQSGGSAAAYSWMLAGDETGFAIADLMTSNFPFAVTAGAPDRALLVTETGDVGIGPTDVLATLHIRRNDGTTSVKVEETSAADLPRTLLNLVNNGRPEIVMANAATNGEWSFGAGTNFILKQGAVGTDSSVKTKYLTLFAGSGNLEIAGQMITGGPTCATGCDAVFDADYDLPSVKEHAAQMFALGHLPNVGPTRPGQPVNMSEQYGRVLNELEQAHIYIARQDERIDRLEQALAAVVAKAD